jgi:tetratricopeptide (TPR) repeat protein
VSTWEVGEPSTAVELFESIPSENPDYSAALQRRGLAQLELGDYPSAQESFEELVEIAAHRPEGWTGLGETRLRQREYDAAVEALERAVRIDSSYRAARYQLGLAYRGVGRLEDAEREMQAGVNAATRYIPDRLTETMEQYGVFLSLRLEQAGAALRGGDIETAMGILEQSYTEYSENVTVLNNLAVAYLQAGRLDSAHDLLEQAKTISDERFSTYINLASWAMRSEQPQEALAFADEAVRRGPKASQAHATRARILNQLGRFPEAAESLEKAVSLDRDDPQMLLALAGLRRYLGELEASLVLYREISERWPQNFQGQLQRARLAAALRYSDEAALALERAREIEPANPAVIELGQYLEGEPRDN